MRALTLLPAILALAGACSPGGGNESEAVLPAVVDAAPMPPGAVTIALGGDVMLARRVGETLLEEGPAYVWGDVAPLLQQADLALVNLECVIAEGGEPFEPERVFYFRAPPVAVDALTFAGIDCVALANNHVLDYRAPALLECLERLDAAGIAHAGAGADLAAAAKPAILRAGGVTVGVVSFADHFEEYAAGVDRPGTNVIPIDLEQPTLARVRAAVEAARAAGADLVVFSIHWGPNMRQYPAAEFRAFARAVLDAGADVFHGHSAHIFQGVEVHDGKPILYDTGDLLDDYAVDEFLRNDRQILFLLIADATGVHRVEMVPLRIDRMQVNLARDRDFDGVVRPMRELAEDCGTDVVLRGDRLVVQVR